MRLVIDSGIFRHWHNRYIYDKGNCWTAEHADHMHDYDDLHYSDLASIFYLYFAALLFSCFVLLIEVVYRRGFCCCKYREVRSMLLFHQAREYSLGRCDHPCIKRLSSPQEFDDASLLTMTMYSSSVMEAESPTQLPETPGSEYDEAEYL